MNRLRVLALCLAVGCHASRSGAPAQASVALVDATVLPMDGRGALEHQDVFVEKDRIVAVVPTGGAVPAGARRVDARGKFVMPGLADAHAHLAPGEGRVTDPVGRQLALYLANGFTTVRALGAMKGPGPGPLAIRDAVRRGELAGPSLLIAAPSINGKTAASPDEARRLVLEAKAAGFDLLKTHGMFDRTTYDAMVAAARETGLRLSGHVTSGFGLARALEAGQQVEHLDGYMAALMDEPAEAWDHQIVPDPALLAAVHEDRMAPLAQRTKDAGIANGPTLALFEVIASEQSSAALSAWPEARYAPPAARAQWAKQIDEIRSQGWDTQAVARFVDLRRRMVRALVAAGAPVLVSSDSPQFFMIPGFSAHREMEALEAAGAPPGRVLEAATVALARWAGQERDWGTVADGMRADLLVLDADPRATVKNTREIAGLVVRGRWMARGELDSLLERVAEAVR